MKDDSIEFYERLVEDLRHLIKKANPRSFRIQDLESELIASEQKLAQLKGEPIDG